MDRRLSLLAIALVAVTSACSKLTPTKEYGATETPYVFPHTPHIEGEVSCLLCHQGIDKSTAVTSQRHVKIPVNPAKNADCSGCHDTDPKVVIPVRQKEVRFRYDHSAHLAKLKFDAKKPDIKICLGCHQKPPEKNDVALNRPPMAACTACHTHQQDFNNARCSPCHVDLKDKYKPGSAFTHEGNWLHNHSSFARPSAASCAACHDQTYCAECHAAQTTPARLTVIFPENVERSFIHRGDYVSRHMIEADAKPDSCNRCHGRPFCQACHSLNNVLPKGLTTDRDPHPPNFVATHGPEARANISSCAACHDFGANANTNCFNCHKGTEVGGDGINPHPPGWTNKHKNKTENAMCRSCHG